MVTLIPQPRQAHLESRRASFSSLTIDRVPDAIGRFMPAMTERLSEVRGPSGAPAGTVTVTRSGGDPQAYTLEISSDRITISATDSLGALYAVQTLVDIWEQTRPHLPVARVEDSPSFQHRGVLVESFWGSDRMTLLDWMSFVDSLSRLKFNCLVVSLYGCWDLRHGGGRSEFLFVPLLKFPELRTPQQMTTWDPGAGVEVTYEYLPSMFEENFFGQLARYAEEQGIQVIPLFGGPGHSSLLPRNLPRTSAVDERGTPGGYGYCVSSGRSRDCLLRVFAELVEEHLLPNGVSILNCGGDEYYPVRNLLPDDPLREISPYCACEDCSRLSPGEQLIEYLLMLGRHLGERGIRMMHWQDSLVRENVLDRYCDRISEEDVPDPIIAWWKYQEPLPSITPTPLETWVTPSPGLIGSLFYQDMTLNIEGWLREGARVGATGVIGYNMPDPNLHHNYACLADLSWNFEGSDDPRGFKQRWASYVCPDHAREARHAYALGESVVGCYPLMIHLIDHLLPYFATSPKGAVAFPEDLVQPLSAPSPALMAVLGQARDTLREAARQFPPARSVTGWPSPALVWRGELERISKHIDLFMGFVDLARRLRDHAISDLEGDITRLENQGEALMRSLVGLKASYQLPSVVREHWLFVKRIRKALEELANSPDRLPSKSANWHAWML